MGGQRGDRRFVSFPSSNEDVSKSDVVKVSGEAMAFLQINAHVGMTTEVKYFNTKVLNHYYYRKHYDHEASQKTEFCA